MTEDMRERAKRVVGALANRPSLYVEVLRVLREVPGALGPWVDDREEGCANIVRRDDAVTGDEAVTVVRHGMAEIYNVTFADGAYLEDGAGMTREFGTVAEAMSAADAHMRSLGWLVPEPGLDIDVLGEDL